MREIFIVNPAQLKFIQCHEQLKPKIQRRPDDGLDREIFVFKDLVTHHHTAITQIVLHLFPIRSRESLRCIALGASIAPRLSRSCLV
jgi:hypothetical protein